MHKYIVYFLHFRSLFFSHILFLIPSSFDFQLISYSFFLSFYNIFSFLCSLFKKKMSFSSFQFCSGCNCCHYFRYYLSECSIYLFVFLIFILKLFSTLPYSISPLYTISFHFPVYSNCHLYRSSYPLIIAINSANLYYLSCNSIREKIVPEPKVNLGLTR